jgi:L-threonylcarbamoyladenylate synthase
MIKPATPEAISQAALIIRAGGVVAFPTETVYGLGANAFDDKAVRKIFEIKKRPGFNPLIVHIASHEDIYSVALLESPRLRKQFEIVQKFWPGPLSVVLPKQENLAPAVTAGLESVAVRFPAHPVARALIKESGVPIAAPSANPFSMVSPTEAKHVLDLGHDVQLILDGGPCQVGLESTIISLLDDAPILLRPGAVTVEQLQEAFGNIQVPEHFKQDGNVQQPLAPGMLKEHYSPKTRLLFRDTIDPQSLTGKRVGLLSFESAKHNGFAEVKELSADGDLNEVAAKLFSALRELDNLNLDIILVDSCPKEGIGRAIMDRLIRASRG